jgi:surface polysaccharide O-acyltransferase-like enzyme
MADVNIIAVIIAAVAATVIGALWYSPLMFARAWMDANGYTEARIQEMKRTHSPNRAIAVSFVCYLALAYVLAVLIDRIGATDWDEAVGVALLVWLGFAATLGLVANMFSDRSLSAYVIDASYQLVFFVVMGAIIGGW